MPSWSRCRVTLFDRAKRAAGDDAPCVDDDADVAIEDGRILVTYWDDHGAVVFAGREVESGRYELVARSRPRRATLVRDGRRLEGDWTEHDTGGEWRIELPEDSG